jgi:hypothetical protein
LRLIQNEEDVTTERERVREELIKELKFMGFLETPEQVGTFRIWYELNRISGRRLLDVLQRLERRYLMAVMCTAPGETSIGII